jgi:hypothetical protein
VRREDFPDSGPHAWLDRPDALERIDRKLADGRLTGEEAAHCKHWSEQGYVILQGLVEEPVLSAVWSSYEQAITAGRIELPEEPASADDPHPGRFLNPHKKAGDFCRVLKHAELSRWLRILLERDPRPLQTIASHKGSQQGVHSDSIHMTTNPLGYLAAAWIAFEDIHPDSGPLVYYPGSHKLPYVFSKDVGISEKDFREEGYGPYHARYEPYIQSLIQQHGLEAKHFHAKKGDVLIWHANLLHGGSSRKNMQLTRKALVCHFFAKGVFVYHDLSATRSKQQYLGSCLLRDRVGRPLLQHR